MGVGGKGKQKAKKWARTRLFNQAASGRARGPQATETGAHNLGSKAAALAAEAR